MNTIPPLRGAPILHLVLGGLPPSVNHAYIKGRGGKRILSQEGRAYLLKLKTEILRRYPTDISKLRKNEPYAVFFRFHIPTLYNKGYPEKTSTRYKIIDVTNRVKLLEDALKDVLAIDDSQHMIVATEKVFNEHERTEVWIWNYNTPGGPFNDLIRL